MKYWFGVILIISSLNACVHREYIQAECLAEEDRRVLKLAEIEFRDKINIEYEGENELEKLKQYLLKISMGEQINFEPSKKLKSQINSGSIIRDIWNSDKNPNLNGDVISCLKKSRSKFLKDYCERIINIGDMSPTIVAEAMLKYLDVNGTDEYVYLVATVNFYLIKMN